MNKPFFALKNLLVIYLLCFYSSSHCQSLDELSNRADQLMMTNMDSSLILYQELEQLAIEKNDKPALGYAIINSAGIYNHKHQYQQAREICLRGLALQPLTRDSFEIIMTLGQSYDQDNIIKTDSLFREAEKLANVLNDTIVFAGLYMGLSNISFSQGKFYESLEYYLSNLNYCKSPQDDYRKSGILVSLSRIFLELENLSLAEQYLRRGLDIIEKNNYKTRYDRASVIYANLLLQKNELDAALTEVTTTRNWLLNNNRFGYRSLNANTHASILMTQEKWEEAETYINQAFNDWEAMNSTDFISYIPLLINRCSLYFHQKKYDQVLETVDEINQLTNEFRSPVLKKKTLDFARKVYDQKNQIDKAYLALQEIKIIEDELFRKEQLFSTKYLEAQYNRQQQQTAIALLDAKNEIQGNQLAQQRNLLIISGLALGLISLLSFFLYRLYKTVNDQKILLAKSVKEKDILLREIHHRVKNNLQLVSSLLGLQSDYVEDPQALEALNSGKSRVKSMALIHQDLYKKENLTGLNTKNYLQKLGTELMSTFEVNSEAIELRLEVDDLNLDVDTLIPLGLIVNELITNSLKYAFPNNQKGFIHVKLFEENQQLNLTVSDNGIGIIETEKSDSSFGFQLIETLLEQLEGEMEHQQKEGTHLSFKMNYYKKVA